MTICATILTGYRPDLLAATLNGSRDVLQKCDNVIVFANGGDKPTMEILDQWDVPHETILHVGCQVPNGTATSICALQAAKSGCDFWLGLEDDWVPVPELVEACPDWFEIALDVASNPAIGQVRLREESHLGTMVKDPQSGMMVFDGSGASNVNWVDQRLVAWQVVDGAPFMVAPHHWTNNPFVMRTSLIGDGKSESAGEPLHGVFPVESERHAMARFYGLNLLVAQMRPGVYRHCGDGRSLEGH